MNGRIDAVGRRRQGFVICDDLPGRQSGRRRLGAAAAGRSGRHDVSERIEEILAIEVGR